VIRGVVLQARTDSLRIGTFAGSPGVGTRYDGRFAHLAELAGLVNARTAGLPPEVDDVRLKCRHGYRAPFKNLHIERRYGNLTLTYAAQVHIAVIEIDSLTHNIEVLDDTVVDDCGR
jgi:CO/xanthine dehydrogenase Mo-binding subunit